MFESSDQCSIHSAPVRAQLFGTFSLTCDDGSKAAPRGRKACALLAYLLLSEQKAARRDHLAALFWSDRGEEQARASLRQALYELRSLANSEHPLLQIGRLEICLSHGSVTTDLDDMQACATRKDAAKLAAIIGKQPAELLAGWTDVADGFDEWLAIERARRNEERRALALSLGRQAIADDPKSADHLADAFLSIEPFDESATALAMEARCRLGDRDGVRRVFSRYADALRRDIGGDPPDEMTTLLTRLLVAADMTTTASPPTTDDSSLRAIDPSISPAFFGPTPSGNLRRHLARLRTGGKSLVSAGAVAAVVALGAAGVWFAAPQGSDAQRVILIERFATLPGDAPARISGDGLASDLSRMIVGNDHGLSIIDRADPAADNQPADYIVTGDAQSGGGHVHANVRLLDREGGEILWSRTFSRSVADADGLRDEIADHVGDVAVCAIGGRNPSLAYLGVETMRLYLQACEEKHGDWANSIRLLADVVQRRPDFAHAWAMLAAATAATAFGLSDAAAGPQRRLAEAYAHHALTLDSKDGEAYVGMIYAQPGLAHWSARYALLKKGRGVDPDNAVLNIDMGFELATVGRRAEGLPFAQRGLELDPFNRWAVQSLLGYLGYSDGDLKPLLEMVHRRWPDDPHPDELAMRVAARVGNPLDAQANLSDPRVSHDLLPGRAVVWRALIQARLDNSAAATSAFIKLAEANVSAEDPDTLVSDAANLVALGQTEPAFALLERIGTRAVSQPEPLFYDYMAPLRANPRFIRIVGRMGLIAIWRQSHRWADFCSDPTLPYNCERVADTDGF